MGSKVYAVDPNLRMYGGKALERGQLFELVGLRNDAKLTGQNALQRVYCQAVGKKTPVWRCPHCAEEFFGYDATSPYPKQHLARQHADEGLADLDGPQVKHRVRRPDQKGMTAEEIEGGEEAPPIDSEGASTETEPHPTRMEITTEGVRTVQRAPR
jgi:hypothetical protein